MKQTKTERLLSLDVMRGITVAGMIMVNNPGDWGNVYAPLRHAPWNGLTPTDLVFPFFMFVMGVSMSFSFAKFGYSFNAPFVRKLAKRTVILFLLGVLISWFALVMGSVFHPTPETSFPSALFPLGQVRILGVLQRLALTYCLGSLLVIGMPSFRKLWMVCIGILAVYGLVLLVGNGFLLDDSNIIAVIDKNLWGTAHMYVKRLPDGGSVSFDPEGLLSTLPGVAHVAIGYLCGEIIRMTKTLAEKIMNLSVTGVVLLFTGLLLSYGCPINKSVWSPSFVLATCGFAFLFLALLMWVIDYRQSRCWIMPFQAFGTNPLFIYVTASLVAIVLAYSGMAGKVYNAYFALTGMAKLSSLLYALTYVGLNGLLAVWMFKRRIFIKI